MHVRRVHAATTPASRPGDMEGADLGRSISEVREAAESLARRVDALARACATPGVSERLTVVEGPFVGDAAAALATAQLWLERSHQLVAPLAQSLAQAHIAAGGLASTQ